MKIYTRTGDDGSTGLFGGKRVSKSDRRIGAYGEVDELNAYIGMLRDRATSELNKELLIKIQHNLFVVGAMLAAEPGNTKVKTPTLDENEIIVLENEIDKMEIMLPPLKCFILPGGHPSVSFAHLARTVCRRAERSVIHLSKTEEVKEVIIKYLNRLSDYLFVLSRVIAFYARAEEIPWKSN